MKSLLEILAESTSNSIKNNIYESENWGGLNDEQQKTWDAWWKKYVPGVGKAKTVGGEIMRAMGVLVYRFYNDGDTVDHYAGSNFNILFGANKYLRNTLPGGTYSDMSNEWNKKKYEQLLEKNTLSVFNYLLQNQNMFTRRNDEDYQDLGIEERSNYHDFNDDYNEGPMW